jgi:hypothetical protein
MNALSLNQILDIAIVLVGIFASLSCVSSWIHEWIASRLALRGWDLFRGIAAMAGSNDAIAAQIFNHPLVLNSSPKPQLKVTEGPAQNPFQRFLDVSRSGPPSYLDARNFSLSFWQVVQTAEASRKPVTSAAAAGATPPSAGAAPNELDALVALADPKGAVAALTATVKGMDAGPLQKSLLAVIASAGDDYDKLLRSTDSWFNAQMDRVSGWYRRRTKTIMFFITLLVVSIAGVDSVAVVKVLSATDPCTLQQFAASAGLLVNQGTNATTTTTTCTSGALPAGTAPFDITHFASPRPDFWMNWTSTQPGYYRWLGILLTWVAVWFGGSFWFDALLSLVNVRSAGRKPERTDQPPR